MIKSVSLKMYFVSKYSSIYNLFFSEIKDFTQNVSGLRKIYIRNLQGLSKLKMFP